MTMPEDLKKQLQEKSEFWGIHKGQGKNLFLEGAFECYKLMHDEINRLNRLIVDHDLGKAYCSQCEIIGELMTDTDGQYRKCSRCGEAWLSAFQIELNNKNKIAELQERERIAVEALTYLQTIGCDKTDCLYKSARANEALTKLRGKI